MPKFLSLFLAGCLIFLLPATIWGVMQFGIYSLIVVVATVLSCVLSEYLFETLMHKPVTISDGSALVTGMILGLNMPPAIPLWMPILGGVFAIIVVKFLLRVFNNSKNIWQMKTGSKCWELLG